MRGRTFHLSADDGDKPGVIRFLSGFRAELSEGKTSSTVTVTRTGRFSDPRYGEFDITREMLLAMVENFNKRTFGQDIFIDVNHKPGDGAAGKVIRLTVEGDRLRALVEWTPFGLDAIKVKGYQYLSAEYADNFKDNEQGAMHCPLLMGAALTVRPVIKRLDPVQLSCDSEAAGCPVLIHPDLILNLSLEIEQMKTKMLAALRARLEQKKLAQVNIDALVGAYDKALGDMTDEAKAEALMAEFDALGKQLAEAVGEKPATIQLSLPAGGMSADDVKRLMAEERAAQADAAKRLADDSAAQVKLLTDTIAAAAGLEDETKKALAAEAAGLLFAGMSDEQVKRLAEMQVKKGNDLAVAKKLSALGWQGAGPAGSVRIEVVDESSKKLSGMVRDALKLTMPAARGHCASRIRIILSLR